MEKVLTVYDFDPELVQVLTRNVETVFAEMRAAANAQENPDTQEAASTATSAEAAGEAENRPNL